MNMHRVIQLMIKFASYRKNFMHMVSPQNRLK